MLNSTKAESSKWYMKFFVSPNNINANQSNELCATDPPIVFDVNDGLMDKVNKKYGYSDVPSSLGTHGQLSSKKGRRFDFIF